MPGALIVNASPLIFLHRVGGLSWLRRSCTGNLLVPGAVMRELAAGWDGPEIIASLGVDDGIVELTDTAVPSVIAAWDLGAGETQVISHGLLLSDRAVVLDDAAARQCARSLGMDVVGTLGIVLNARRSNWIPAARPVIERLVHEGLYLNTSLVTEALGEVGE
jgi:predicted nucleic acid-binding protein